MEPTAAQCEALIESSWTKAWKSAIYRKKFLTALILFTLILLSYPYFFSFIQHRQGVAIDDYVLSILPSYDMSPFIFLLVYLTVGLGIYRAAQSPILFLLFLWSCLFLSVARIITMILVPLEPPSGLVALADPVLIPFYQSNHITKDLFFSGHTGAVFLIFLFLRKKGEKIFALIATVIVAILLLIQHIHYTWDILFAPFFVYLIFFLAKKVTKA